MNFILSDDIDFYKELNNIESDNEADDMTCLLTNLPLDKNNIELSCGHKFNFEPLFKEVCNQKCRTSHLEITKLKYNEIKCPYCRQKQNKILPHVKLNNTMKYINGVNNPEHLCMDFHTCQYLLKSGKNKGTQCSKSAFYDATSCYCMNHHNIMSKKQNTTIKAEYKQCIAILKSGKRKGESCNVKVSDETNECCKRHTSK